MGVAPARVIDATEVVVQARGLRACPQARGAHDAQRASVKRDRLGIPPLIFAQHAQIVQRARQIEIAAAKIFLGQRDGTPAMAIAKLVTREHATDAAERAGGFDPQAPDVGVAQARVTGEQRVGAKVKPQGLGPAIAHLPRGPELELRRGDVGVPWPFVALEQRERPAGEHRGPTVIAGFPQAHRFGVRGNRALDRNARRRATPCAARAGAESRTR